MPDPYDPNPRPNPGALLNIPSEGEIFTLSQETACEWISCLLKNGVLEQDCEDPNSTCEGIETPLNLNEILSYSLPKCDGTKLCSVEAIRKSLNSSVSVRVDACSSCGKKVIHYWALILKILPNAVRKKSRGCSC